MKINILGDGTEVRRVDGNNNMNDYANMGQKDFVTVSKSALDSLKAMAQRLQTERDELLEALKPFASGCWTNQYAANAKQVIAKCTSKPEVLA